MGEAWGRFHLYVQPTKIKLDFSATPSAPLAILALDSTAINNVQRQEAGPTRVCSAGFLNMEGVVVTLGSSEIGSMMPE